MDKEVGKRGGGIRGGNSRVQGTGEGAPEGELEVVKGKDIHVGDREGWWVAVSGVWEGSEEGRIRGDWRGPLYTSEQGAVGGRSPIKEGAADGIRVPISVVTVLLTVG